MAELINPRPEKARAERIKYVSAFFLTMRKIWAERIVLLGAVDTMRLYWSVKANVGHSLTDEDVKSVEQQWEFLEYGLWVNYGTGREVYRGNPGDIGRDKVRKAKPWFSKKFFASYMNMKEFMADNLGKEFLGMVSNALDYDKMRFGSQYYRDHPMPDSGSLPTRGGTSSGRSDDQVWLF